VGYALSALPQGSRIPWHRVINAQGATSARRGDPAGALNQRLLLEAEGVSFGPRGRVSLERYGWSPRRAR
jgi:methylated-DNA-protein-cysteine methyltransferase-like protein